jgi:putative PIN family toxin of toxin-antitoxin system
VSRVTADSNIWISALIFGGKPMQLVDLAIVNEVEIAISAPLLDETLRIMRHKFKRTPEQLQTAEDYIIAIAKRVAPNERIDAVPTDVDDNHVVECAVAAGSDVIVSGDSDLLRLGTFRGITIQKVSDFLAAFQSRSR